MNPRAFVVLKLAVASANVNANEMSTVPLPVDTLKKNSTKKWSGGVGWFGGHTGSTILFLGRICAFIYERIHAQGKTRTKKHAKSTTRVAKSGTGAETTSIDSTTLAQKLGDVRPMGAYWKAFFPEHGCKEQNDEIKN